MEQQGAAQRRKSKSGDARDGGRREHGDQRIADAVDTLRGQHGTFRDEKPEANDGDGDHGERARLGGEPQGKSCGLNELFWHTRTCVARRRQSSTWRRSVSLIWKLQRGDAHHGCRRYRGAPGCSPASSRARTRPRDSAQSSSPNVFIREKSSLGKGSSLIQAVASLEPRGSSRFVSHASDIRRATRKSLLSALFLR